MSALFLLGAAAILLAATVTLAALSANARDQDGNYRVMGIGIPPLMPKS